MCREIENITDQLLGFTEEVANVVEVIESKGFSREHALKIVELGIEDIKAEVEHHRNKKITQLSESMELLGERISDSMKLSQTIICGSKNKGGKENANTIK